MAETNPLDGKLEPETKDHSAGLDNALTSIAISLKRIADAVAGGESIHTFEAFWQAKHTEERRDRR